MILKQGVKPTALQPQTCLAMYVADKIWAKYGQDLVITSINDGSHSKTSLHWCGCAFDCRTKYFENESIKKQVRDDLANALREDYDVILERIGDPQEHIHVEYQPRG